ncbi:MAG: 2-dehydropantoate 2-reductase [Chloroflexi bacterium]|nr:2-dehydropantoate 2-reductase [Chloroflexota bacterium]
MRIIIYGVGGIGGVVGGHLARVGYDVALIGRPNRVRAISKSGLRLITPSGNYTLRIPAFTGPVQVDFKPDDVVFLCMKGQDTEEALKKLRAVVPDIPIFCLQNGVRNEQTAARYFPRVYGVMVRVGAHYIVDDEAQCHRDPPGWFVIGRYRKGIDALAESVATALRAAGFLVKVSDDVMPYKWGKLVINMANAVDAITDSTDAEAEAIVQAAQREAEELLAQAGIHWVSAGQLEQEWPEIAGPVRQLEMEQRSSTWQSLTRHQGTVETEFLNGEFVLLANKLGRRAPINEGLLRISKEMAANSELPGKYTSAQLAELLGLGKPA